MNKRIAKLIKDPPAHLSKSTLNALERKMIDAQKKAAEKAKQLDTGNLTKKDRDEFYKLALKGGDAMFEYILSGGENPIKATKKQTSGSSRSNK